MSEWVKPTVNPDDYAIATDSADFENGAEGRLRTENARLLSEIERLKTMLTEDRVLCTARYDAERCCILRAGHSDTHLHASLILENTVTWAAGER